MVFLDLGDFFIKLDRFDKKIKDAESEFTKHAIELGSVMKKSDGIPVEYISKISSDVSRTYRSLEGDYEEVKKEFNMILKQVNKANASLQPVKEELSKKKELDIRFLLKALDIYNGVLFANSTFNEVQAKLNKTLNDFASVIGHVKGITETLQGFQSEKVLSEKEIEKLQRSIEEITGRYIW